MYPRQCDSDSTLYYGNIHVNIKKLLLFRSIMTRILPLSKRARTPGVLKRNIINIIILIRRLYASMSLLFVAQW